MSELYTYDDYMAERKGLEPDAYISDWDETGLGSFTVNFNAWFDLEPRKIKYNVVTEWLDGNMPNRYTTEYHRGKATAMPDGDADENNRINFCRPMNEIDFLAIYPNHQLFNPRVYFSNLRFLMIDGIFQLLSFDGRIDVKNLGIRQYHYWDGGYIGHEIRHPHTINPSYRPRNFKVPAKQEQLVLF